MSVAIAALLLAAAGPIEAGAQQVRILADGTAIRLDPDASSPIVTSMASGTVLRLAEESGEWYAVSLAGDPDNEVIGYVLAAEVEVVDPSAAPSAVPAAPSTPAGGVPPLPVGILSLEERYERERERRSSGVGKVIWGLVLAGGAYAALEFIPPLQIPVAEDYQDAESYQSALDRRGAAESGRSIATALGAALGAWGLADIGFGWRNMRDIELELPRSAGPSLQERYNDAFRMRSSGRRKVFWAVFLPVLAYGTVEFVPYFAEPDAEDFDNAVDYDAAVRRRDRAETAKRWTAGVGAGLGVWGLTQWILGARTMSEIEATARTAALSAPLAPSATGTYVGLFADRRAGRTQFGVQLRW